MAGGGATRSSPTNPSSGRSSRRRWPAVCSLGAIRPIIAKLAIAKSAIAKHSKRQSDPDRHSTAWTASPQSSSRRPNSRQVRRFFGFLFFPFRNFKSDARIDQFATHERKRRFVIELNIVKRIGEDFGRPDQSGLH